MGVHGKDRSGWVGVQVKDGGEGVCVSACRLDGGGVPLGVGVSESCTLASALHSARVNPFS